jgi:hypothetical protein
MFDIGQKVICVNDKFSFDILQSMTSFPKNGRVYTVRDLVPAFDYDMKETCAILLQELINPPNPKGIENGFSSDRFRTLEDIKEVKKETNKAYN